MNLTLTNYFNHFSNVTLELDFGRETQQRRLWPFFEARGDHKLFLKCQLESTSPVAGLKLTSFSNWRTARPIQFDVTYPNSVSGLKLTSFFELADGASYSVRCNIS